MIYDAFLFFDELDLLEIRLNELGNVVDHFVIVEAAMTFTGNPKLLHYADAEDRFAKWKSKIIHIILPRLEGKTMQDREAFHRDAVRDAVRNLAMPQDVVIFADLDEIPRASVVRDYKPALGLRSLAMSTYRFFINAAALNEKWSRAKIMPGSSLVNQTGTQLRWRTDDAPVIPWAGWHFTSTGGADRLAYKLASFCHAEDAHNPALVQCIASGKLWNDDKNLTIVEIDETFPAWIQEHLDIADRMGLIFHVPAGDAEPAAKMPVLQFAE